MFAVLRSEIQLHEAARKNDGDKVRKLIAEKVDVNSRNNVSTRRGQERGGVGHEVRWGGVKQGG